MEIQKAEGKLGVLVVGIGGAVSSTFVVGTLAARKGLTTPIGSLTQMAYIELGKGADKRESKIKDVVPLADLNDLVIGGWDIFEEDVYGEISLETCVEKRLTHGAPSAQIMRRQVEDNENYLNEGDWK